MHWSTFSLDSLSAIQIGVVGIAALIAAAWDIFTRRIPNWLTFPMIISGLIWSFWARGALGFLGAFAAVVLLSLPYVLLFAYAGGGGGDAKIMAGIGAWVGLLPGLLFLGAVAFSGVLVGMVFALSRGQLSAVLARVRAATFRAIPSLAQGVRGLPAAFENPYRGDTRELQPMPYGVAILVGVGLVTGGSLIWHA